MFSKKTVLADLLFVVQIVLAFLFFAPQIIRLIESTQGQSLSMQFIVLGFTLLNMGLAFGSHRMNPGKVNKQILTVYGILSVLVICSIGTIFINGQYSWSTNDTVTTCIVSVGIIWIVFICKLKKIGIKEPMIKGLLAVNFKSLTQLMMALKILTEGGAGVPSLTIIFGNVAVGVRIAQIIFSVKESGWNKNLVWLFVAEASNEITWAIVSIVWLKWFLSF